MSTLLYSPPARPRTRAPECPLPLYRTAPPYDAVERAHLPALAGDDLPPGTVLVLQVNDSRAQDGVLVEAMDTLFAHCPTAPVVLWLHATRAADVYHLASRASSLGARAILLDPSSLRETLTRSLTEPADLGAAVVDWLGRRGVRLTPELGHLTRHIFALAPRHPELSGLLREIGASEATARFRFSKKSLPPPGRWHQAARALHLALRIQAQPERALFQLALALGYADHSAASQLLSRTLRVSAGTVRGTLGWEWLLERWLCARVPAQRD